MQHNLLFVCFMICIMYKHCRNAIKSVYIEEELVNVVFMKNLLMG